MIVDMILLLVQGVLEVLLLPLSAINIVIDFASSIPIVSQFLSIVAYILPWSNILPLIIIVIGIFLFRIAMAVIKAIWHFIPVIGN